MTRNELAQHFVTVELALHAHSTAKRRNAAGRSLSVLLHEARRAVDIVEGAEPCGSETATSDAKNATKETAAPSWSEIRACIQDAQLSAGDAYRLKSLLLEKGVIFGD